MSIINLENTNRSEKYFAIWVNATIDINPSQKLEITTEKGVIISLDSFDVFFKNPENARDIYAQIFQDIKDELVKKESTKLSVYSQSTNVNDIQKLKTTDFKIKIVIKEWTKDLIYNLWVLCTKQEVNDRLEKLWLWEKWINLDNYWLDWIINSNDNEWYTKLFNYWIWWWTHNIASSVMSFSKVINSKWFKIIAPNSKDKVNKYTSRTSLFLQRKDWEKYCIRTDALDSQLNIVKDVIEINKNFISDILVTDKKTLNLKWIWLHSVPTYFSENVLHNVSTVVFNCEDREMWEVIIAVMLEAKNFLDANNLDYQTKTYLTNLLSGLEFLKKRLDTYNSIMILKKEWIVLKKIYIDSIIKLWWFPKELKKETSKLPWLEDEINDFRIKRLDVLKEILISLIEITKITEKKIEKSNETTTLWRVVIITDWPDGSVWSIETDNHEIRFTNTVWNIGDYEKKFFRILNKLSSWQIDININDTTWCWDSSTAAAIMIRENEWKRIRRDKYIEIFNELWVPEDFFDRASAISESYFLSHFQEVISGIVYHCKKSNLWDIPNSDKINKHILWYVFKNTQIFIREWMNKFIYTHNNSSIIDRNVYDWFNVFWISSHI